MHSPIRLGNKAVTRIFVPAATEHDNFLRDSPDAGLVDKIRRAYPTEHEYDEMLTRKMRRRSHRRPSQYTLNKIEECLRHFLNEHVGHYELSDVRWLSGGASKIQVGFNLDWEPSAQSATTRTEMVLRMEPPESLNATSRRREFQLISAVAGTLPVPQTFWVDAEGDWFPEPAIVYSYVDGATKPAAVTGRVSGTGNPFESPLREALGTQFVSAMAQIHTLDWRKADLSAFDVPEAGTHESAYWQLNRALRVWEEDRGEDWPLIEVAANWLEKNLPVTEHVSLVHGDFRSGNFLFDEGTSKVTAWLDWERGHLGDRHRDLAWSTLKVFGNYTDDGHTFLVSGLIPKSQFFEEYERLSGLHVDPQRLRFYRVFTTFQLIISNLATAYRVVRLGRSHQDILLAWVEGVVYPFAHQMLEAIDGSLDV